MKKYIKIITAALVFAFSLACDRLIEIEPPKTELVSSTVFNNDQAALSAMAGAYATISSISSYLGSQLNGVLILASLSADEMDFKSGTNGFVENEIDPTSSEILGFWNAAYRSVYEVNLILEKIADSPTLSVSVRTQLEGECKFLRAVSYFYLLNFFGDVPLLLSTDYRLNSLASRTPSSEIYHQIEEDLRDARTLLPTDFSIAGGQRIRASHWAATAFLARVQAYNEQWEEVVELTSSVINNPDLFELGEIKEVTFAANSPAAIWQLLPNASYANYPSEAYMNFFNTLFAFATLSEQFVQSFEANDKRRNEWITYSGSYFYTNKYSSMVKNLPTNTEYSTILRLAEQYLLRAEAKAHMGDIDGGIEDVNPVRLRAGLLPAEAANRAELLAIIEQERKAEFFAEYGHRWLDLKRWGKADSVLGAQKPNWRPNALLYPIPEQEILRNPNLR